jgi:hypothetical protein
MIGITNLSAKTFNFFRVVSNGVLDTIVIGMNRIIYNGVNLIMDISSRLIG